MTYIAESTDIGLPDRLVRYRLLRLKHMLCRLQGRHRQFAGLYIAMKRVQQLYYHKRRNDWVLKPIVRNLILNYCSCDGLFWVFVLKERRNFFWQKNILKTFLIDVLHTKRDICNLQPYRHSHRYRFSKSTTWPWSERRLRQEYAVNTFHRNEIR